MSADSVPFDPDQFTAFRFASKEVTWTDNAVVVTFGYALDTTSERSTVVCEERFEFPLSNGLASLTALARDGFERLTNHLGLVAALSYYKLAAPKRFVVGVGHWTAEQIQAHAEILQHGLGEYFFVNQLDPDHCPEYGFESPGRLIREPAVAVDLRAVAAGTGAVAAGTGVAVAGTNGPLRPLVPVGGGKDSCVTIEALRNAGLEPTLITVNRYPVISEVIDVADLADVAVRRILDPQLRSFNERGARNGHVPATAIVSLAVCCAAVLGAHDTVVMSNERSASEGNVTYRAVEINHQWSKSLEAENILRSLLRSEVVGLDYFSLLRPWSELSIARSFGSTCDRYFDSFSSCNAAFRLDPSRRVSRWCGHCPKCQFVYLALATALPHEILERIWDAELFSSSPVEGFRALLGLTEWKPFECVGESGECRVALAMLVLDAHWSQHPTLSALAAEVKTAGRWPTAAEHTAVFGFDERHNISPSYEPTVRLGISG